MMTAPTADSHAAAGVRRGAAVSVRNLTKSYPHSGRNIEVLRGLNFDLLPGEMASVVGASGVGKSTLLHVLGTLDTATSGTITFDGVEVTSMDATRLAEFRNNEIGFVFQFHHLLPEFTALENAMMPGLINRLPRATAAERATTMLRRLGLGDAPLAPARRAVGWRAAAGRARARAVAASAVGPGRRADR